MRNVLVTGADAPLGRMLLEHLRGREGVEHLVGVQPATGTDWIDGVELLTLGADHRDLVGFLADNQIDTVVHCGLAPDRNGSSAGRSEARVVDTMRLAGAVTNPNVSVAAWVVASSSAVYALGSQAPLLQREDGEIERSDWTPAASLLEAEDYVRDVATRAPHINVSILRLQHLVGEGVRSPLASVLTQPWVPSVMGYDASVQLLAAKDAVRALAFAAEFELAGIYNVASAGTVRFSEAIRAVGRRTLPLLPIEAGPFGSIARRIGVPHVPDGMLGTLRFGHALDTSKITSAGFHPEYDQAACLASLA